MPVFITEKHLVASAERKTISDNKQLGFALRTTPNGVFTFYYQHLNKKTGKRDWHVIGTHPEWTPSRARTEATRLAGLIAGGNNVKSMRQQQAVQDRAQGVSFQQLADEYLDYCKQPVARRWGTVPRKESWQSIEYCFKRPLEWWASRPASGITSRDLKELYDSYVSDGHPAQANSVRKRLKVMFDWGMHEDRQYLDVNPCRPLLEDDKAVERADTEDGRVLTADEIRTLWHGIDHPDCPGDRLSRLTLKLSLATLLRTGECVVIERDGISDAAVTIPLKAVKGRRSKKAREVVQPLNSLAREVLDTALSIGDAKRKYVFPGRFGKSHMLQKTLGNLMPKICIFLGLKDVTAHDARRTSACILEQLGYDDALIGKVMTHKATNKEAAPVTRKHYLVPVQIIAKPVDPRVKALDDLDKALREIIGKRPARMKLAA